MPQVVGPDLLPGIAHLLRIVERDGEMNPTVRAISDPIAFRRKVDLVAFVRIPDRFA